MKETPQEEFRRLGIKSQQITDELSKEDVYGRYLLLMAYPDYVPAVSYVRRAIELEVTLIELAVKIVERENDLMYGLADTYMRRCAELEAEIMKLWHRLGYTYLEDGIE